MYKRKLPADPTSLILGIIALVLGIAGCCCYGISAIIPLGLGIAGLVMANKSIREYKNNPGAYEQNSYTNVNMARIINIIAVILNAIVLVLFVIIFAIYGTFLSAAILEDIRQGNLEQDYDYESYEWETNKTEVNEESYIIEKDIDSVNTDSTLNKN